MVKSIRIDDLIDSYRIENQHNYDNLMNNDALNDAKNQVAVSSLKVQKIMAGVRNKIWMPKKLKMPKSLQFLS